MARYELKLPHMGESVAEATITNWLKQVGDTIEADDIIVEVATDKVDSEVPCEVSGVVTEILFEKDQVVQVGQVMAVIETSDDEQHTSDLESYSENEILNTDPAIISHVTEIEKQVEMSVQNVIHSTQERFYSPLVKNIAQQENISAQELEQIQGTGLEGRVTKYDILAYLEKRESTGLPVVETTHTQYTEQQEQLTETYHQEEQSVEQVTAPEQVESAIESVTYVQQQEPIEQPVVTAVEHQPELITESEPEQKPEPFVQQIIPEPKVEEQIPVEVVAPKTKEVKEVKQENTSVQPVSDDVEVIEMTRMGKLISKYMVESKRISPHVQSFTEVDVTKIWNWRNKVKKQFETREQQKLTFTPIFIEAVAKALRDFPMMNVTTDGERIFKKKNINIGMATALPNGDLIVPVIKNADTLSLIGLAKSVNDLAKRARENKLKPDEIKGGTYTITNIGSFGNVFGTPIINQPEVGILAIGAIQKVPSVIETPDGDMIGIRYKMMLSHSYDHRVVNGALGGMFVQRVAHYLEKWDTNRDI